MKIYLAVELEGIKKEGVEKKMLRKASFDIDILISYATKATHLFLKNKKYTKIIVDKKEE